MQIKDIQAEIVAILKKNPDCQAEREFFLLLSYLRGCSISALIASPELTLSDDELKQLRVLACRRAEGFPFAYISGHKEFYGLDFCVNENVLIPRPETEIIVDFALSKNQFDFVVDIGCGSGAIIISLASKMTGPVYWGLDISEDALAVARLNIQKHKLSENISLLKSDLLNGLTGYLNGLYGKKIIACANLPYLRLDELEGLNTVKYEPRLALLSGEDGMEHYQRLFRQISESEFVHQNSFELIIEIDPKQVPLLADLERQWVESEIFLKDYSGRTRFAVYKNKGESF